MFIYIYTEYIHIYIYILRVYVYIYILFRGKQIYIYICYVKFPHINVTVIYWCAGWFVYLLCSYIWLCMCMLIILKSISNFSMFCSILSPLWFSSAWLVSRTLQENMVFIIIATQKADQRVGQTENLREICSNYHPGNTFRFFFFGLPPKKTQIFATNPLLGETGDVLSTGRCNVEPWGWRRSISVVGLRRSRDRGMNIQKGEGISVPW